jgi:hypothetical protein
MVGDSDMGDSSGGSALAAVSHISHPSSEVPVPMVEPHIEVVTVNGRVEKIIVTCSGPCRVELDCTY